MCFHMCLQAFGVANPNDTRESMHCEVDVRTSHVLLPNAVHCKFSLLLYTLAFSAVQCVNAYKYHRQHTCSLYSAMSIHALMCAAHLDVFHLKMSYVELVENKYRTAHCSSDGGSDMQLLDYSVKKRTDEATNEINS